MTFREFLSVLTARWRIVTAALLLVVAAAAVTTLTTPPIYTATARVFLSTTTVAAPGGSPDEKPVTYALSSKDLNTFADVLTSPAFLDPLRTQLGLPDGHPVNVSATVSEASNMLTLTAVDPDPQLVADIANAAGPVLAGVALKFAPLLATNGQAVEATSIVPAGVPSQPTSPNARKNLAIGGLAGLGLGVGLALLRHAADTRVRTKEDLQALSDRPILGSIPFLKAAAGPILTLESDPHSPHAEAIRRLRTNILFVDVTTGGHSFVITSSVPGEGKTTTTLNLGMAMADAGSRVLVIDGDLRNPSVGRTMGMEGGAGLTTILLGRAEPVDVIQQRGDTSLFILPAGQVPPNPSELLGSEPMAALFGKLSQEFDFILVDSPPVVPVIDAVIINKLTHGLIMVVGAERTRKRDLASAVASLDTVGAAISGFALNLASNGNAAAYRYGHYGELARAASSRNGRRHAQKRRIWLLGRR